MVEPFELEFSESPSKNEPMTDKTINEPLSTQAGLN